METGQGASSQPGASDTVAQSGENTMTPLNLRGENLRGRNFTREACRKGRDFLQGADLRQADLRGARLRGLDLSRADLRGAKLQGADLRQATLVGADLRQVVTGVRWQARVLKSAAILSLTALQGSLFALMLMVFTLLRHDQDLQPWGDLLAAIYAALVCLYLILLVWRGVLPALSIGLSSSVVAVAVAVAGAGAGAVIGVVVGVGAGAVVGAVVVLVIVVVAVIVEGAGVGEGVVVGIGVDVVIGVLIVIVLGVGVIDFVVMALLAMCYIAAFWYASCRAWRDDPRFALLRRVGLWWRCWLGTNFTQADLRNANLTGARLGQARLRGATLHHTCLREARDLHYAQDKDTLLADPVVRQLLVTGAGQNGAYARKDLRGASLVAANLRDADLTEADVSGAALCQGDLRDANLTKLQAIGTDFTGANLTGACVEAWNIDHTTKLDDVVCAYVYLLGGHGERRPASGQFGPGEFTKLFEEVFHTVDLIFRDGIDWQALLATVQRIRQQAGSDAAEVRVQGIEDKGDGVFVVRVHAPPGMPKERLHADLRAGYQEKLARIEARYQEQLAGRDTVLAVERQHNASLTHIVESLASKPLVVYQGGTMHVDDHRREVHVGRDNTGQLNLGDHSLQVAESIKGLPETDTAAQMLKQHLDALRRLLDAETTLAEPDKTEALHQVHTLARAAAEPHAPAAQARARTVGGWFRDVLPALTGSQQFLTEVHKLVNVVSTFFGAADAGE